MRPRSVAASYFLGFAGIMVLVVLWMRGLLRPMLPVLIVVAVVWIGRRILRSVRAPLP